MKDRPDQGERPLRADARRNRQRVLDVAAAAFTTEGPGVSVHEIARRAGVGTGTVSRHFPTKDALFQAIVLDRIEQCVAKAHTLAETHEPGAAFLAYFAFVVDKGAVDRLLADALVGGGFDIDAAAARTGYDLEAVQHHLLTAAQRAGTIRPDVDTADVQALIAGCLARERDRADPAARARMVAIACDGLLADRV